MTTFELLYACTLPLEHPLHQYVHRTIKGIALVPGERPRHLDVGGRRSTYTCNVPAEVWITDVPRERELQRQLDLGATDAIRDTVLKRRSNVAQYLYDDMTQTKLPDGHFSSVTAVEVLEHVEQDEQFVANVARVLKPGGVFVMTTPNGDFRPIPFPDHKRHYKGAELEALLKRHFDEVRVEYRVNADGLFSLAIGRRHKLSPMRLLSGVAYGLNAVRERMGFGGQGPAGKNHLFAVCKKKKA
jgi:SAM-dependent methyltransferase